VFRGVPYAQPPVGKLRFRPPEAPLPWDGVRPAIAFAKAPIQNPIQLAALPGMDVGETDEDALYLNVWTPGLDGARRPVMVWIHGGAFVLGAGHQAMYDGAPLARRGDVVVVTINYRLGAFGFLAVDEAGNVGIRDQIAALEWVRDNIASFGGDPGNVTIFGESAGGMSVGTLLGSPRAEGLFAKAIPQSGSTANALDPGLGEEVRDALFAKLGVTGADELIDVPADTILEAQVQVSMQFMLNNRVGTMPFQPAVDGDVVPARPIESVREGRSADVAILVGSCLDEMKLFALMDPTLSSLDDDALRARVEAQVGEGAPALLEAYRSSRPDASSADIWQAISTDFMFRIPALRLAEAHPGSYVYLFTWPSPAMDGALGACHAIEIPFVFGTLDAPNMGPFVGAGPEAEALSHKVMDAWLSFARDGRPVSPDLPEWPAYDETRRSIMLLGKECTVESDPYGSEREAWTSLR
jgi:para-nitrobenzyl esterase